MHTNVCQQRSGEGRQAGGWVTHASAKTVETNGGISIQLRKDARRGNIPERLTEQAAKYTAQQRHAFNNADILHNKTGFVKRYYIDKNKINDIDCEK